MKILAVVSLLFFATQAFADLGGCVVYKAKYVLKNGQSVTGYLPLTGYDDYAYLDDRTKSNAYCSDKAFQQLLNRIFYQEQKKLEFGLFEKLDLVQFSQAASRNHYFTGGYAFTDSSSIRTIHLDSIRYTIFLQAKNAEWDYPEVGIQVLDVKTANMMREQKVVNQAGLSHPSMPGWPGSIYEHFFEQYDVLNYNKNISQAALEAKLAALSEQFYAPELRYIQSKGAMSAKQFEREKQRVVLPIILKLREEGIILIQRYMTC